MPPSVLLRDENLNITHVLRDAQASCRVVLPFILNKHTHPLGISNPKYHCYMNSVTHYSVSTIRPTSHNFQFNCSMRNSLSTCLYETAHRSSSSTNVDALKFRLAQYDAFYDGQIQQDSSECLTMLIQVINKGSIPYCGYNDNNATVVPLSEILFSFMLEIYIVCDAGRLMSPSFESSSVFLITLPIPLLCRNW